jgi:hypothetical protein
MPNNTVNKMWDVQYNVVFAAGRSEPGRLRVLAATSAAAEAVVRNKHSVGTVHIQGIRQCRDCES